MLTPNNSLVLLFLSFVSIINITQANPTENHVSQQSDNLVADTVSSSTDMTQDIKDLMSCLTNGVQFQTNIKTVDNYYEKQVCWTEFKRAQAMKVYDYVEKLPLSDIQHFNIRPNHEMFDLVPETYSCDARIGPAYPTDGGKWFCSDHVPSPHSGKSCSIFSLGSAGEFGFEEAIKSEVPNCKIYTFDCTGTWSHQSTEFYNWCVGEKDEEKMFSDPLYQMEPKPAVFKTWQSILNLTGVERVDLLKMDIEHFEWQVLPFFANIPPASLPTQILLEIHYDSSTPTFNPGWLNHPEAGYNSAKSMIKLMRFLDGLGYRVARMEYNWFGGCCAEVVLIRNDYMINKA
ncbi:methyltransferase domain-containing protein [Paraphysoderma sedebokerense]|nr:methyltransferase domain-containing protein [Paraphysoderma sedebokerense]